MADERLVDAREHERHDRKNARTQNSQHAAGEGEKIEQHNGVLSFSDVAGGAGRTARVANDASGIERPARIGLVSAKVGLCKRMYRRRRGYSPIQNAVRRCVLWSVLTRMGAEFCIATYRTAAWTYNIAEAGRKRHMADTSAASNELVTCRSTLALRRHPCKGQLHHARPTQNSRHIGLVHRARAGREPRGDARQRDQRSRAPSARRAADHNSPPLTLPQLRGKVVLVDFWTYSCVNCVNTLPYVKNWYKQYGAQGLQVIGVHTPEYPFERDAGHVSAAVRKFDIRYPVALDNQYATWNAFDNQYWPALYLFDKTGHVVYSHFGEGDYAQTEAKILELLAQPA
jgi:thiol-disulfide isomerase/thioredoxin